MRSLLLVLVACSSTPQSERTPPPTRWVVYDTLWKKEYASGELVTSKKVKLLNDCTIHGVAGVVVLECPLTDLYLELDCAGLRLMREAGVTYDMYCDRKAQ